MNVEAICCGYSKCFNHCKQNDIFYRLDKKFIDNFYPRPADSIGPIVGRSVGRSKYFEFSENSVSQLWD